MKKKRLQLTTKPLASVTQENGVKITFIDEQVATHHTEEVSTEMGQEEKVLSLLVEAWNEFIKLESQHPNECSDFCDGIHQCQNVLGMRVARKYRPDLFPIKK